MLMPGLNLMANILPGYPEGFIHLRESTSAGHGLKLKQTYWKKKRGTVCDAVPLAAHLIPGNFTWWPCEQ